MNKSIKNLRTIIISITLFISGLVIFFNYCQARDLKAEITDIRNLMENRQYAASMEKLSAFLKECEQAEFSNEAHFLLGQCFFNEGDYENAIYEFEGVLVSKLNDSFKDEAAYFLGESYFRKKEYNIASEYYDILLENSQADRFYQAALYGKAWVWYEQGDFKKAREYFNDLVTLWPSSKFSQSALFRLAICSFASGDLKEAEALTLSFIERYPLSKKIAEAHFILGEIEFEFDRFTDAVKFFTRALDVDNERPWSGYAYYHRAWALLRLGRFNESIQDFKKIQSISNNNQLSSGAIYGEAYASKLGSNPKDIINKFGQIEPDFHKDAAGEKEFFWKAAALAELGERDSAEALYRDAIRKFPASKGILNLKYNFAGLLFKNGSKGEAADILDGILEDSDTEILKTRALISLARLKDPKEALIYYDKVLKYFPESEFIDLVQYNIGLEFMKLGDFDNSILTFKSLVVNNPSSRYIADAKFNIAASLFEKGDYENSALELKKFLKNYPENKNFEKDAQFRLAVSLYKLNKFDEAIPLFLNLKKSANQLGEMAAFALALSYQMRGKTEDALKEFRDFLKEYPSSRLSGKVYLWLADYFYKKGDYTEALEFCNKSRGDSCDEHYIAGLILYSQNKVDEAIKEFEALKENKGAFFYEKAVLRLAAILSDLKKDNEAFENYELLTKSENSETSKISYRKMAEISKKFARYDEAINYYLKAISEKDSDLNAQIQFQIAEVFELKNDLVQAASEYKRVNIIYSASRYWNIKALEKRALISEKLKRFDEAEKLYEELSKSDSEISKIAKIKVAYYKKLVH